MNFYPLTQWITKKQASEVLDVCVRSLERRMKLDEEFPKAFKRKGVVRFRREDIEAYREKVDRERQDRLIFGD